MGNAFGGGSDRGPDPGGDGTFTAIINKTSGSESEVICSNRTRANGGIGCSNHHTLSLQCAPHRFLSPLHTHLIVFDAHRFVAQWMLWQTKALSNTPEWLLPIWVHKLMLTSL